MQSNRELINFNEASPAKLNDYLKNITIFLGQTFAEIMSRRQQLLKDKHLSPQDKTQLNSIQSFINEINHAINKPIKIRTIRDNLNPQNTEQFDQPFQPELIAKIISFLSYHELTPLLSVSKEMMDLVLNTKIHSRFLYFPKVDILMKTRKPNSHHPIYKDILLLRHNLSEEIKTELFHNLNHYNEAERIDYADLICTHKAKCLSKQLIASGLALTSAVALGAAILLFVIDLFLYSPLMQNKNDYQSQEFYFLILSSFISLLISLSSCMSVVALKHSIEKHENHDLYTAKNNLHAFFFKNPFFQHRKTDATINDYIIDIDEETTQDSRRQAPSSNTISSSR